jgi:hypothetical protein
MSRCDDFQGICAKALTCNSEEEAFEIIERLKPYLKENGEQWDRESEDQPHVSDLHSR